MTDPIIRVENLSKKYILSHQEQERYSTLRDAIAHRARSFLKTQNSKLKTQNSQREEFWALKDVSFEINRGDRVGIIGRNGAGKSTLLKILSRITEPTSGRIEINGRVASLLEVGTGFHPELTGRENIFLNGAILGMSKVEIQRKFDEIVAFAEVEKFLDTPVKRYSSGMYVRLAFAVAAHLEPEILIVDEVLAVGDAKFQKKCLGKMQDVSKEGRTVLFVSHNMGAISNLCNSAILLNQGTLKSIGSTEKIINQYLTKDTKIDFDLIKSKYGFRLVDLSIYDSEYGYKTNTLTFNRDYHLHLALKAEGKITQAVLVFKIFNSIGILVSSICSLEEGIEPFTLSETLKISFSLPQIQLLPGQYTISIFVYRFNETNAYFEAESILIFEVESAMVQNASWAYRNEHGIFRVSNGGRVTLDLVATENV